MGKRTERTELQQVKEEVSQLKEDLNKLKETLTGVKPKTEIEQVKAEIYAIKQNLRALDTIPHPKSRAQEITEQRDRFNSAIIGKITKYLELYPSIRFGQALVNLGIIEPTGCYGNYKDPFNEEPFDTYLRMIVKEK